ncbi:MAG: sigma-70 family RNA polymerase sigma factor [Kiritimatiellae bacterium]|nr:sigma-70 family RNA polymerase sigma factor [Kiritimatiellia bacterium]
MGTMQVWEEIRLKPESGARALVEAYSERLYKLAYRLCSNSATAEDLAIRTIARAVRASGEFASEANYFSFLCSILVNLHRDDLRLKGANALVFVEDVPEVHDEVPNPAESLVAKSDADEVRAAVASLSPLLRETVVLRYYSGLSDFRRRLQEEREHRAISRDRILPRRLRKGTCQRPLRRHVQERPLLRPCAYGGGDSPQSQRRRRALLRSPGRHERVRRRGRRIAGRDRRVQGRRLVGVYGHKRQGPRRCRRSRRPLCDRDVRRRQAREQGGVRRQLLHIFRERREIPRQGRPPYVEAGVARNISDARVAVLGPEAGPSLTGRPCRCAAPSSR